MLVLSGSAELQGTLTENVTKIVGVLSKFPQYVEVLGKIADKLPKYLPVILNTLEDPALDDVLKEVARIKARQTTKSTGTYTPPEYDPSKWKTGTGQGIGLVKAVKPLQYYNYAAEHKWVLPTVIAGAIAVPLLTGFLTGRITKRCPSGR